MGPVNPPLTAGGKIFASAYALYAGLLFIVTAALLLTPVLHRLMHRFHWDKKPKDRGVDDVARQQRITASLSGRRNPRQA